ncbi:hypothetical protein M405DRAFT_831146, partial [Rhizopogon salebrosus TDB-379]
TSTTCPPSSVLKKNFSSKGQIHMDPLMYHCDHCRVILLLIQAYELPQDIHPTYKSTNGLKPGENLFDGGCAMSDIPPPLSM